MKISEVIYALQEVLDEHGDIELELENYDTNDLLDTHVSIMEIDYDSYLNILYIYADLEKEFESRERYITEEIKGKI